MPVTPRHAGTRVVGARDPAVRSALDHEEHAARTASSSQRGTRARWPGTATTPRCPTASMRRSGRPSSDRAGRPADTLCAFAAEVAPTARRGGLAAEILRGMREIAGRHSLRHLIAPVRPSLKERYPLAPIERYVTWRREDRQLHEAVAARAADAADPNQRMRPASSPRDSSTPPASSAGGRDERPASVVHLALEGSPVAGHPDDRGRRSDRQPGEGLVAHGLRYVGGPGLPCRTSAIMRHADISTTLDLHAPHS